MLKWNALDVGNIDFQLQEWVPLEGLLGVAYPWFNRTVQDRYF